MRTTYIQTCVQNREYCLGIHICLVLENDHGALLKREHTYIQFSQGMNKSMGRKSFVFVEKTQGSEDGRWGEPEEKWLKLSEAFNWSSQGLLLLSSLLLSRDSNTSHQSVSP